MQTQHLPSVPRLANPHADTQLLVGEIAEYLHPDLALQDVRLPIFQGQSVGGRADGRRTNHVPLHLDTLGRRARGDGPRGRGAPVEAQRSDLTGVEVAQVPGVPVHLFGLEVGPLVAEFVTVAERLLWLLVLRLRLHLERLPVLVGQAVLRLLDFLVQCFAQFPAEFPVGQASLTASLRTGSLFLRLAPALAAGACLRGAAVGVVAVSERRFDGGIQRVPVIPFLFGLPEAPFPFHAAAEMMIPSSFLVIIVFLLLFCLDLRQKFRKIRVIRFLQQRRDSEELLTFWLSQTLSLSNNSVE